MRKLIFFFITMLLTPSLAQAWPGKIIAVDSATRFVVLKDGQTPVKVQLAGVKQAASIDTAKARLDASNIALMKDVEINAIRKTENEETLGDITINGNSLTKELLDEGIVQSIAQTTPPTVSPVGTAQASSEIDQVQKSQSIPSSTPDKVKETATSNDIISELSTTNKVRPATAPTQVTKRQPPIQNQPVVQQVQTRQPVQGLGLWPASPVPVYATSQMGQPVTETYGQSSSLLTPNGETTDMTAGTSTMKAPGDIAKQDYELAVKVQKNTRRTKNKGFLIPKKKSETFIGGSIGAQLTAKQKNTVPYSTFGATEGASVRHFFPSGIGIGSDFMISSVSGKSGTSVAATNSTNATTYDYKNKSFTTYTFTGSLLYRFYADRHFVPYVALHGGYSLFSYPNTDFNISDGAPVAGGGAGLLYKFDSGFTLGTDLRYLKTLGTKSGDPDGFFNTTINLGYTFD
ncbi:hypothetical protein [Maridesulfovibrio zosterae]|uniref:hypothetical protein n=1 Tax=Maridesulfovibrio zosterae TaxID=82171 RepID=UPI000423C397|nr:hypothetical protein [Maridesulfovibrio zosterae]